MNFDPKPRILFNLETKEAQKQFYDNIKMMHERRNDENDPVEREELTRLIDNNIIEMNHRVYPESWNYFDTHFMSEEGFAKHAETVYDMMGVERFTFNTGRETNGEPAIQNRLLKMFKGRPRCDVRINEYNDGLVILERW